MGLWGLQPWFEVGPGAPGHSRCSRPRTDGAADPVAPAEPLKWASPPALPGLSPGCTRDSGSLPAFNPLSPPPRHTHRSGGGWQQRLVTPRSPEGAGMLGMGDRPWVRKPWTVSLAWTSSAPVGAPPCGPGPPPATPRCRTGRHRSPAHSSAVLHARGLRGPTGA